MTSTAFDHYSSLPTEAGLGLACRAHDSVVPSMTRLFDRAPNQ
jgi:hypothetical protein